MHPSSTEVICKPTLMLLVQVAPHIAPLVSACAHMHHPLAHTQPLACSSPLHQTHTHTRCQPRAHAQRTSPGPLSAALRIAGPPLLRTLVRLAFHDCASATCDGCIDIADALNNPGLGEMQQALQPVCANHSLPTADCWAAAASIALEEASYNGADLVRVPLFFGRTDAATCTGFTQSNPEASFPAASAGAALEPHPRSTTAA